MRKKKKNYQKLKKPGVKKGDIVKILCGKDRGKQGRILSVDYQRSRITVEGVNIAKKAIRPSQQSPKGGIIDMALPVHISNVKRICPKCNQPTRVIR